MGVEDDIPEGTAPMRKVRMSETLFKLLGASRVDWGEPDAEGFYTPVLYTSLPSNTATPTEANPLPFHGGREPR